ncbi:helix-turn-helix domain-containing protein [Paraburkholderia caribensis]|uniref:Helix-turn-helix domain-containing protein n=1 Tax=Paraburkholderia caribensis TaxID=75105 RepID=A0A9Q6RZY4_9BURK|nr:helix-turn-helix domain-containing protein [Paraburkholderia caribensis]MCO4875777.1 helix-turn-helix domain-containing protein [Paraburkholderia caribensis]PTB28461.1 hypothetical protein C9I56_13220 [Paraburkholderia caribensis]QLB62587.1 hypothetical protein A9O66_09455 [Paraburkholderia caribensis]
MTISKNAGNSADAQRARLLEALRSGPLSTLAIRSQLDVLMPAARVFELRQHGHNIQTTWVDEPTDGGRLHRVAKYALFPSAQTELFGSIDSPFALSSPHKSTHVI